MAPNDTEAKRKPSTAMPSSRPSVATPSRTPTRKRKLQPELKDRVETFLANASPSTTAVTANVSNSTAKRRKVSVPKTVTREATTKAMPTTPRKQSIVLGKVKTHSPQKQPEEKRMRVFRKAPPRSYLQKLERAQTQRMIVLNRKRVDEAAFPCEEVELVGSTGNVYKVTIGLEPKCTCPDFWKGNQCKHIVYVLATVLKAPPHLSYQLAFLSSELREIFNSAPAIPSQVESADDTSGKRKPVDGECPICYMDFEEEHNELVWCKAACGNNMHKSCFDQWAASQKGSEVRCVYCRTAWQAEAGDLSKILDAGMIGDDGYVNVAHLTGHSTLRDVSSYHQHWVRRNYYGTGY